MTSKQRAYLKGLASTLEVTAHIGKNGLTPETTKSIMQVLEARELIKIGVLKACLEEPADIAGMVSERTHSQVVQVIGRKIVLYREGKQEKKKIILP